MAMESQTTSPAAPLETLPLHIFEYICKYVTGRTLFSLSLTSRLCCDAATPQRFSRLRFRIRGKKKLRGDLRQWAAVLGRDNRFRHVRRIVVDGAMPDDEQTNPAMDDDDDDSDTESVRFSAGNPPLTRQHKQVQHGAWLLFAQFLAQLPGLTELVYACTHQIPACVLTALHQHHPRSRLHMHAFSLRSLYQEREHLHDIDPDEYLLATSPCLYSIHARCERYDTDGRFSFNLEALEYMVVSGCAPRLKRVRIAHGSPGNSLSLQEAIRAPRDPWKGFHGYGTGSPLQQTPTRPERASLEELVLSGGLSLPEHLEAWSRRTDFGALQHLGLYGGLSPDAVEILVSMAVGNEFRSLRKLAMSVGFDTQASDFLQAVSPLEELTLSGHFGRHTFATVLRCHGPTLRKLHLQPSDDGEDDRDVDGAGFMLRPDRVREIQQWCPKLEDIRLPARRRQGGPDEVAVYRALGRLPRLQRATLLLDCRSPGLRNLDVADLETETTIANIRKALANAAVDEALARAIFSEILSSAAANAPPLLQHLRLETDAQFNVIEDISTDFDDVARWTRRSWLCARDDSDESGGSQVTVREIGYLAAEATREYYRDELELVDQECRAVWRELWPRRPEVEDWRDDWRSFPLGGGEFTG